MHVAHNVYMQPSSQTLWESFGIRGAVVGEEEGRPRLNFGLAAAVYQWDRGASFADVVLKTKIQEVRRCHIWEHLFSHFQYGNAF